MDPRTSALLAAAVAWHDAGALVVPVCTDGSKAPGLGREKISWRADPAYAHRDLDRTVAQIASGRTHGIGVLCGAVSGGLEMLEAEGRALAEGVHARWLALLDDHGLRPLHDRVATGYTETTPRGGLHLFYRVADPATGAPAARRSTRLAARPATPAELAADPAQKIKVLLETRGDGGFAVTAPSAGTTHPDHATLPSRGAWTLTAGGPAALAVLTPDERDALWAVATLLDQIPPADPGPPPRPRSASSADGTRPGDDYNRRATWDDLLVPAGWTRVHRTGTGWAWRRPGKTHGISATTGTSGDSADRLYVFSTSTGFTAETPYTKFGAYTLLAHAGDHSAAARALRAHGYGAPRTTPPPTSGSPGPGGPGGEEQAPTTGTTTTAPRPDPPGGTLAHSEDAHALALLAAHGHRLRYCPQREQWLRWTGAVWAWDGPHRSSRHAREHAKTVARALPEDTPAARAHKRRALSAAGTTACLQQAATDPAATVDITALDADPWVLATPGGTLDLRTGRLRPPDPADLATRSTAVAPDPAADPRPWQDFLAQTFPGDPDLIAWLARLVGYSCVGRVREHLLPFCHGSGGNGKGVFLETVAAVLGGYATTAPAGFLMATPFPGHETEIARLAGARMVVCSEVDPDARFDEARVKALTGGDTLTARFMRADHFTFHPTHQLWLAGNHKPAVRAGGRALWRRLRLVPFDHEVPDHAVDPDLGHRLAHDHGPAVLAWIAAGAAAYAATGLAEPARVTTATAGYALETDTVARFADDLLLLGGGDTVRVPMSAVRAAYERWCAAEGETPVSPKALGQALRARHGVGAARGAKGLKLYTGLTLLDRDEPAPDAPPGHDAPDDDRLWASGWPR